MQEYYKIKYLSYFGNWDEMGLETCYRWFCA